MNTVKKSCNNDKKTGCLINAPCLETLTTLSKRDMPKVIRDWLISLQQDSPANHFLPKEKEGMKKITEIYGQKQLKLYAESPLSWFCLKMCGEYKNICPWSYETCEKLAIPLKDPLPNPPLIADSFTLDPDCGYLPTNTAMDGSGSGTNSLRRRGKGHKHGLNLRDWFRTYYNLVYPPVVAAEYMMGYPIGWTGLKPLVMDKFHKWLQLHGEY